MITFAIEDLQYKGTLIIMNDEVVENVEQFGLQIEALDGVFPVNVVDATVIVTITDDDGEIICSMHSHDQKDRQIRLQLPFLKNAFIQQYIVRVPCIPQCKIGGFTVNACQFLQLPCSVSNEQRTPPMSLSFLYKCCWSMVFLTELLNYIC